MNSLLVYTVCNKRYYMFIPLFILSTLRFNKDTDVEIGIDSRNLDARIIRMIDIIGKAYPDSRILIDYDVFEDRNGKAWLNGKPMTCNAVRFVTEPRIKNEYTYISDIDIICLEEMMAKHVKDMVDHNSDYSNMLRENTERLTGLHFTRTSAYYPLPDLSGMNLNICDEIVLRDIVRKRCVIDPARRYRPVHGIHLSLNRHAISRNGEPTWNAGAWKRQWKIFESDPVYKQIYPYFDIELKSMIDELNDYFLLIK